MNKNVIQFIVDENGQYLNIPVGRVKAKSNLTTRIQLVTPISASTAVNYLIYDSKNINKKQYLIPTGDLGSAVVDPNNPNYQLVAGWNVYEADIYAPILSVISRFRTGKVGMSFEFVEQVPNALCTNFVGYFGHTKALRETANNGDYFICEDYNFWIGENLYNKGDILVWYGEKWNNGGILEKGLTETVDISVDPAISYPTEEVDETTFGNAIGEIGDDVAELDTRLDGVETDLNDKQDKTDLLLETTDKTVVGAINELDSQVTNLESKTNALEDSIDATQDKFDGIDHLKDPDKTYLVIKIPEDNDTFELSTGEDGSPNYVIEWGDGESETITTTDNQSHIYEKSGMYLITISDNFENGIEYGWLTDVNKDKIVEVHGGSNYPTSIISEAFYNCTSLTTVNFPNVTNIGNTAFMNCESLTEANFPQVASVAHNGFNHCKSLTEANFPQATNIANYAFNGCTSLTIAHYPQVTSIGGQAFNFCTSLTTANFPQATSIGFRAFQNCTALKDLTIGNVTTTDSGTRFQNVKLTNLTIADDVTDTEIERITTFYKANGGTFTGNETKHSLQVEKTPDADNDVVRNVDLTDYAKETWVTSNHYKKSEIDQMISIGLKIEVVAELPTEDIRTDTIYLVPKAGEGNNNHYEYIYLESIQDWEKIGETDVDLTNYYNKAEIDTKLTDYSTIDYVDNLIGDIDLILDEINGEVI